MRASHLRSLLLRLVLACCSEDRRSAAFRSSMWSTSGLWGALSELKDRGARLLDDYKQDIDEFVNQTSSLLHKATASDTSPASAAATTRPPSTLSSHHHQHNYESDGEDDGGEDGEDVPLDWRLAKLPPYPRRP